MNANVLWLRVDLVLSACVGFCNCFPAARTLKQLLKGVFRRLVFCTNMELQASETAKVAGDRIALFLNLAVKLIY